MLSNHQKQANSPPPLPIHSNLAIAGCTKKWVKRTVARSHRNAPRVRHALDARQASLATVATVC